jgi:hypothetical protein
MIETKKADKNSTLDWAHLTVGKVESGMRKLGKTKK